MEDGKGGKGRGGIVRAAGEGVWFAIIGPLRVGDGVLVGSEGSRPSGMSSGCNSGFREVFQVFVICIDTDRVGSSLHVDTPLLECLHNCQIFFIIDWIIQLRGRELSRVETERVEVTGK